MRIFVQNGGKSYVIPCKDTKASVAALKREVLARFVAKTEESSRYTLVLVSSGAVLFDRDAIQDVLQEGDFISLRKCCIYSLYRACWTRRTGFWKTK